MIDNTEFENFNQAPSNEAIELFGRRRGYSDPKYPCFFHIHHWEDASIAYMDDEVCKEFDITLDQIRALKEQFLHLVMHSDDIQRVVESLMAFKERRDENEIFTYFQRIRLKAENQEGYTLVITSAKLDIQNETFMCFSNATDQLPTLTKKISNALNTRHDTKQLVNKYLQLTKREREVLTLIVQDRQAKQIADDLFLSIRTIEQHKKNIYKKLEINSIAEAIKFSDFLNKGS